MALWGACLVPEESTLVFWVIRLYIRLLNVGETSIRGHITEEVTDEFLHAAVMGGAAAGRGQPRAGRHE